MLLGFDIGNTNVTVVLFNGETIVNQWRLGSDLKRTGDEYASVLLTLFKDSNIDVKLIKRGIISSVVPALTGAFVTVCSRIIGVKPYVIKSSLSLSGELPVRLPENSTHELGTDLFCNAVSSYLRYGKKPCIVVDFGTALTLTVTDQNGIIRGITITPGLGTAIKSLASNTAQLPFVPLEAPDRVLGQTTRGAIQSGVVLGYKGLVEGLVSMAKKELCSECGCEEKDVIVIATGGLNSVLKPLTDCFSIVDKDLTVLGLNLIDQLVNK